MKTYRFHAAPVPSYFRWSPGSPPGITSASLAQTLAGVVVRQVIASPQGGYDIAMDIERPTHGEALADIEAALGSFGYATTQAVITEWATSVVETGLLGTVGGGALGSATKDPLAALAGALIGFVVGAAVGSTMRRITAIYQADRLNHFGGGWNLSPMPIPNTPPIPEPFSPFA